MEHIESEVLEVLYATVVSNQARIFLLADNANIIYLQESITSSNPTTSVTWSRYKRKGIFQSGMTFAMISTWSTFTGAAEGI